jgi:hypothetical protein
MKSWGRYPGLRISVMMCMYTAIRRFYVKESGDDCRYVPCFRHFSSYWIECASGMALAYAS